MKLPIVNVGILTDEHISFIFSELYMCSEMAVSFLGRQEVACEQGKISLADRLFDELHFVPQTSSAFFELEAVTIGVHFHWERKENQRFKGTLVLKGTDDGIVVINQIGVEDYLKSVISSEMSATSSLELLKAHAVISRSWLFAQTAQKSQHSKSESCTRDEYKLIRWYDREEHTLFDVCADDHCQRYQGITRATTPMVEKAVCATFGEVLMADGELCDARFSKSCGGVTECFENCWEPKPHSYLKALRDARVSEVPDLTVEEEAERWIRSAPESFCNTNNKEILSQVLNNYDQETMDFYRWKVSYTQTELVALIERKSGMIFGSIIDLLPMQRGTSGRIVQLKIVGSQRTFIIGKELEIRRTLSETHLYSSAFVIDKEDVRDGIPQRFVLTGAGWGHGVGLCQIGAAVMATQGFSYRDILAHYYPGSSLCKKYENS